MDLLWFSADTKNKVFISEDLVANFSKKIELQLGQLRKVVTVEIDSNLPFNTVAVPKSTTERYTIPTDLPYEIVHNENMIKIGPVIGILCSFKRFFSQEHIGRMLDYNHIKGLFFVCSQKDINVEKGTIKGYYYNPSGKTRETQWIEGIFPMPNVLYNRRKILSSKLYKSLTDQDVNVFNSHYLNKWQQFKIFSKNVKLKNYFPETRRLSKTSLLKMLKKYNEIYVKPTSKANGEGIRSIGKNVSGYSLKENDCSVQIFKDINSLYQALRRKNYVLQQSVAYKTENRNVDFRVYLQKDETKQWNCPGFICKISKENSIITNYKNRHKMLSGKEALTAIYNLPAEKAKEKEREMIQLCERLAEIIEAEGIHIGDVAFDIILDSKLKLWVLEIQIRYRACRKEEVDSDLYYKSMVTPLYYAKAIADFKNTL